LTFWRENCASSCIWVIASINESCHASKYLMSIQMIHVT